MKICTRTPIFFDTFLRLPNTQALGPKQLSDEKKSPKLMISPAERGPYSPKQVVSHKLSVVGESKIYTQQQPTDQCTKVANYVRSVPRNHSHDVFSTPTFCFHGLILDRKASHPYTNVKHVQNPSVARCCLFSSRLHVRRQQCRGQWLSRTQNIDF